MARRVFFTILAVLLALGAFDGADPTPRINLFGVMFLFFGFVVWFYWAEIEAGYAYLDDNGAPRAVPCGLMFVRFAPMYLRELTGRKNRRR